MPAKTVRASKPCSGSPSRDVQLVLIGANRAQSEPLRQAMGFAAFPCALHYAQSVGNAVAYIGKLRRRNPLMKVDLVFVAQPAMLPSVSRAVASIRSQRGMAAAPIVVSASVADRELRMSMLKQGVCAVLQETEIGGMSRLFFDVIVDGWFGRI